MKSVYFSLILLLFISCAPAKEVWVHRLPNFSAEPIELLGGCMPGWIEVNENGEETYIPLPQYGCSHCGQLYFTKE